MYIGPWQEYRLSQEKTERNPGQRKGQTVKANDVKSDVLKQQLRMALENSLDPDAAQQALNVVNAILEDSNDHGSNKLRLPNVKAEKNIDNGNCSKRKKFILPQLNKVDSSVSAIASHRSTKSEPVHSSETFSPKLPRLGTGDTESIHHKKRTSNYDPKNVVNILRIERNSRRTQNLRKPDFSQFWNWQQQQQQQQKSNQQGMADQKKHPKQVEKKVQLVKKMYENYRQPFQNDTAQPTNINNRLKLSPIQKTPRQYHHDVRFPSSDASKEISPLRKGDLSDEALLEWSANLNVEDVDAMY